MHRHEPPVAGATVADAVAPVTARSRKLSEEEEEVCCVPCWMTAVKRCSLVAYYLDIESTSSLEMYLPWRRKRCGVFVLDDGGKNMLVVML